MTRSAAHQTKRFIGCFINQNRCARCGSAVIVSGAREQRGVENSGRRALGVRRRVGVSRYICR